MHVPSVRFTDQRQPGIVSRPESDAKRQELGELVAEQKRRKFRLRSNHERQPRENSDSGPIQYETIELEATESRFHWQRYEIERIAPTQGIAKDVVRSLVSLQREIDFQQ